MRSFLILKSKPAVHSPETCHSLFDLFIRHPVQMRQGHSSHPVLNVDAYRNSQPDILDAYLRSDKINKDLTVSDTDVFCVKITLIARVSIHLYTRLHLRMQGNSFADNQCPARLDKGGVMLKTFQIRFGLFHKCPDDRGLWL